MQVRGWILSLFEPHLLTLCLDAPTSFSTVQLGPSSS